MRQRHQYPEPMAGTLLTRTLRQLLLILFAAATIATHAQDPLTAYPKNYKLILDNPQVRVLRCHYGPHEHVGVHNHSDYPTIYVYLSDSGPVRFSHIEERAFVMTRPPVKAGTFRVSPGRPERHTVENLSDMSSDYLRIELKQIPLHGTLQPFRGEAPATLTGNSTTTVFHEPQLTIQRIVCHIGPACTASEPSSPTLLVAFSSLKFAAPGQADKQMQSGDIQWLEKSPSLAISATTPTPAHLLSISLK
jgi:hypothetical protein